MEYITKQLTRISPASVRGHKPRFGSPTALELTGKLLGAGLIVLGCLVSRQVRERYL